MTKKQYKPPKIYEKFNVSEPVETGCCLRSCGGSPMHMNNGNKVNDKIKEKLVGVKKTRVS